MSRKNNIRRRIIIVANISAVRWLRDIHHNNALITGFDRMQRAQR